jgi:hypothetical protein
MIKKHQGENENEENDQYHDGNYDVGRARLRRIGGRGSLARSRKEIREQLGSSRRSCTDRL